MSGPFTAGHKVFNTDLNPILLGWVDLLAWYGTTLAYVSADAPTFVFSIDADVTAVIEPGMRVKLTQTTDKFFIVTAVGAFSAGHTQITVYGGTDYTLANTSISAGSFSTHKKPFGFNASPAKWTETLTDTADRAVATPSLGVWANPGALSSVLPIGVWRVAWWACLSVSTSGSAVADVYGTLSAANNSQSDAELSAHVSGALNTAAALRATESREKTIAVSAKTAYFLNIKTGQASMANIDIQGGIVTTTIRAVCAYL